MCTAKLAENKHGETLKKQISDTLKEILFEALKVQRAELLELPPQFSHETHLWEYTFKQLTLLQRRCIMQSLDLLGWHANAYLVKSSQHVCNSCVLMRLVSHKLGVKSVQSINKQAKSITHLKWQSPYLHKEAENYTERNTWANRYQGQFLSPRINEVLHRLFLYLWFRPFWSSIAGLKRGQADTWKLFLLLV